MDPIIVDRRASLDVHSPWPSSGSGWRSLGIRTAPLSVAAPPHSVRRARARACAVLFQRERSALPAHGRARTLFPFPGPAISLSLSFSFSLSLARSLARSPSSPPGHPATQSPSHPVTQSPSHPVLRPHDRGRPRHSHPVHVLMPRKPERMLTTSLTSASAPGKASCVRALDSVGAPAANRLTTLPRLLSAARRMARLPALPKSDALPALPVDASAPRNLLQQPRPAAPRQRHVAAAV